MEKWDWKNKEKSFYRPGKQPEQIFIPRFNFLGIKGKGNPNSSFFQNYIGALYALSYAIKMSPKAGIAPKGYYDYCVYPLEGVWDIDEDFKNKHTGIIDKDRLVFHLMIRQPDFVSPDFAYQIIELTKKKKPNELLDNVIFDSFEEGLSVQMLHTGSYDNEPMSFSIMEKYVSEQQLKRSSLIHREIYLTDARKTSVEKQKTILRFQTKKL